MPHQSDVAICNSQPGPGSPNDDPPGDAAVDGLVHEIEETTTDPDGLHGWRDGSTYRWEIADKCWPLYEPSYPANGARANVHLGPMTGGKDVYIQRVWKNVNVQQCAFFSLALSGPPSLPTAGTYVWTANPAGGPSGYSYKWYLRYQGFSDWIALGTSQAESLYVDGSGPNFSLLDSATNTHGQSQSDTVFVTAPPYVTIAGPGYIPTKGTYQFHATTIRFSGTPTFTWYDRFCDDWEGTSCTAWQNEFVSGSTFNRTLDHDCSIPDRNYQLRATATHGSESATNTHLTGLCSPQAP